MPYYLVHVDNTPPDDKPWLLSTRRELQEDASRNREWERFWSAQTGPDAFPGPAASLREKLEWGRAVEETLSEYIRVIPGCDPPIYLGEVLNQILFKTCPEEVTVELLVRRSAVGTWQLSSHEVGDFFASPDIRRGPSEITTWSEYADWLAGAPSGTTAGVGSQLVRLASRVVSRSMRTQECVVKFITSIGLGRATCGVPTPPWFEDPRLSVSALTVASHLVGGNPHYPRPGGSCVAFEVIHPGPGVERTSWENQLERRKLDQKNKMYLLVPRDSLTTRELLKTPENYAPLWLPAEYDEVHDRIMRHCRYNEGECSQIRWRLSQRNADSANLKVEMLSKELWCAKTTQRAAPLKLCFLIALARVMDSDTSWIRDNDAPEALCALVSKTAMCIRDLLHRYTDVALELGPPQGTDEECKESREALFIMLGRIRERLESSSDRVRIRFNFKPGKKRRARQPRTKNESDGDKEEGKRGKQGPASDHFHCFVSATSVPLAPSAIPSMRLADRLLVTTSTRARLYSEPQTFGVFRNPNHTAGGS